MVGCVVGDLDATTFALPAVTTPLVRVLPFNNTFPLMADWPPPEAEPAGSPHNSNDAPQLPPRSIASIPGLKVGKRDDECYFEWQMFRALYRQIVRFFDWVNRSGSGSSASRTTREVEDHRRDVESSSGSGFGGWGLGPNRRRDCFQSSPSARRHWWSARRTTRSSALGATYERAYRLWHAQSAQRGSLLSRSAPLANDQRRCGKG